MCVWTLEKKKWTLKKSDQLSPYSFSCLRAKSAADQNDGKRGGEKEKDRTAKYSCRRSKGSPAPVNLLWCWGGAGKLHLCNINFNPCTPEGATMQIQSVTIYFNPCVTIYFNPCTPEGVPAQIAYFLHSINFNPCTPEGAPV